MTASLFFRQFSWVDNALFYSLCQPVITMRRGEPAMKPMRQVLLADGNPAHAIPAREALTGGRFQSFRTSVESPPLFAASSFTGFSGYLG